MNAQAANPHAAEIEQRVQALHDVAVTPQTSLALRAQAWGLLADLLVSDYLHRWNGAGRQHLAQAEQAVDAALAIDPELPLAHYASGFIYRAKGQHQEAHDAFARTVTYDPNFARAYAQQGNQKMYLGRPEETAKLVKEAISLSPNDPSLGMFYWILGRAAFLTHDYPGAIEWLQKSVDERGTVWYNRLYLVSSHALNNDLPNAQKVLTEFDAVFTGYSIARVIQHEDASPKLHPLMKACRDRFRDGLRQAGMSPT
jgi:tetratricopeptide (TPR) repeat protein